MNGPLLLTTARWLNRSRRVRDPHDGIYSTRWSKVLAHHGSYEQFAYGRDHPSSWRSRRSRDRLEGPLQRCIINSSGSGTITVDMDTPHEFINTRTAQLVGRPQAMSTHRFGYHVLIDARAVPRAEWPVQGPIAGGDIKSCGFVPVPGSWHWDDEMYEPVPGWRPVPATPELIAAINADLADQREHRRAAGGGRGGGGGNGGGHDGEIAAVVLSMILKGLSKEECYEQWCKIAIPRDPGWPYTWDDFERHYGDENRGGLWKAAQIRAEEELLLAHWLGRGSTVPRGAG